MRIMWAKIGRAPGRTLAKAAPARQVPSRAHGGAVARPEDEELWLVLKLLLAVGGLQTLEEMLLPVDVVPERLGDATSEVCVHLIL